MVVEKDVVEGRPQEPATGNIYNGLWYPILVAVMTAVIGGLLLRDTKNIDLKLGSGVEAAHYA